MNFKHLTINDRNKIEVLILEGYSSIKIAKTLGAHYSTIAIEVKKAVNIKP